MRKTIVIAVTACMFVVSNVMASHQSQKEPLKGNLVSSEMTELSTFCKAIINGDIDLVKKLIALGEDVNKKSLGKTPAIYAARYNQVEILKVLIANGADLSIKSNSGYTIAEIAEMSHAKEALRVINAEMHS